MRPRTPEQLWALSRRLHSCGWKHSARLVKTLNFFLHKCLLPAEAQVGKDLILEHYGLGVVIHPQVKIGDRCRIYHNVTLAAETWIGSPHYVNVEDDVTLGAHSIVVCRPNTALTIGRGSTLGAGSVLTRDIPSYEVWAGNPARKIRSMPEASPQVSPPASL